MRIKLILRGKRLGLYRTPDQYVFYALQRHELAAPHHAPVFAEIDTITSHFPWEQVPRILPWNELWVQNGLIHRYPGLRDLAMSNFVRGAITGLGFVNVWLGVWEAVHYRENKK